MGKHFQLLDFLRRAPKALLQTYCERNDILQGFDWGPGMTVSAEQVANAIEGHGAKVFRRTALDFRAVWQLAGTGFSRGVLNETQFRGATSDYATVRGLKSNLAKAFWTTLERPELVANAKILSEVDQLPAGAWIKRIALPSRPGPVDQAVVDTFEGVLIDFFTRTEHRGGNCKIDCLRRGDEEIFFTYAEDHPDIDLFWQDRKLQPQILHPSFKVIFKHNDLRRTLDIYIEGDRRIVPDLQQLFARSVIGEEIPRETPGDDQVYNIEQLREPGFQFQHSEDLGIADVRVTMMRFTLDGDPWRRFIAEADNFKTRDALEILVENLTAQLPKSRLVLDQVCIKVLFHKRDGDRKAPSRTFYITSPDAIRLKKDDLGELIDKMLIQSEIERPAPEGEQ